MSENTENFSPIEMQFMSMDYDELQRRALLNGLDASQSRGTLAKKLAAQ